MIKKVLLTALLSVNIFASEIIIKDSYCSVDQTIQNIKHILNQKGLRIFTVVDHSKNAASVKMDLTPAKVIIFGNPKIGTKLMENNITVALDLPMKVLVYQDEAQQTKVVYRDGNWLALTYAIEDEMTAEKVNGALDKITTRAGLCKKD